MSDVSEQAALRYHKIRGRGPSNRYLGPWPEGGRLSAAWPIYRQAGPASVISNLHVYGGPVLQSPTTAAAAVQATQFKSALEWQAKLGERGEHPPYSIRDEMLRVESTAVYTTRRAKALPVRFLPP